MNLLDITLFSLKRQPGKKLFMLLAMVLSITTIFTLYTFIQTQTYQIEKQFDEYGANIIITPKTDSLSLSYGGISFSEVVAIEEIDKNSLERINEIPNVSNIRSVAPKLVGAVEVENRDSVVIVGTDFSAIFSINSWWSDRSNIPEDDNRVILGFDVASQFQKSEGDEITINDKLFIVDRVLEIAGNQDDSVIIASYPVVEELLGRPGKVSLVEVSALCKDCPIDQLVYEISEVLPGANVRAIREVMVQRMEIIKQIETFSIIISIILVLLCSLLIFSHMTSSVNERYHEIGIFRAIGFSKKHIISIIQSETLIISLLAITLGLITSITLSLWGIPQFVTIDSSEIVFDSDFFIRGSITTLLLACFSALLPSLKASGSDPVRAINSL